MTAAVLVLNSSYIPIQVTSVRKAINLILKGKARVVKEGVGEVSSTTLKIRIPTVIAVQYGKVPKKVVRFSKLNILYRDDQVCAYCGKRFPINQLTIDHVIPLSKWNIYNKDPKKRATSWTNCVCACTACNTRKGSKLLSELGWKLLKAPKVPEYIPFFILTRKVVEDRGWLDFCNYNVRIIEQISV